MNDTAYFSPQPVLESRTLRLRPIQQDDFEPLYAAASDPRVWEQHPSSDRYQRAQFTQWFTDAMASGSTLIAIDRDTARVIGSSRFYEWDPAQKEVAIGYTFLAHDFWGGKTNAEMKRLMLAHAFVWAKRVWFHVAAENKRSKKAMEKIGGVLSHRGIKTLNGTDHDYYFFRIDSQDWSEN
ncbi:GNAT family N-acetyltransferase [Marinobacter sp. 1Y8]